MKIGDIKNVKKFALIPTKVKGEWIWLKEYIGVYIFSELKDVDDMNTFYYYDWVLKERILI